MSKPNRKQIERLLAEGAALSATISKIEANHAKKLAPLQEQLAATIQKAQADFASNAETVTTYKAAELAGARDRLAEIEVAIKKELELGIDGNDVSLSVIEHHGAKATVEPTRTEATLAPQVFFDTVPETERDERFWGCMNVLIQNARKFLGKTFDEVAKTKRHFAIRIKWPES